MSNFRKIVQKAASIKESEYSTTMVPFYEESFTAYPVSVDFTLRLGGTFVNIEEAEVESYERKREPFT